VRALVGPTAPQQFTFSLIQSFIISREIAPYTRRQLQRLLGGPA
jgi:hypothetical protein